MTTSGNPQAKASWVFGVLLLLFVLSVFTFGPNSLPTYKQQLLAYLCALLAGCFALFFTGSLLLNAQLPLSGKWTVKGGAGFALFLIVLFWWNSPKAPIEKIPPLSYESERTEIAKYLNFLCDHASLYNPMSWEIRTEVFDSISAIRSETGMVLDSLPPDSRAKEPLQNMQRSARLVIQNPAIFPKGRDTIPSPVDSRWGAAVPQGIAEFRAEFKKEITNLDNGYGLQHQCDLDRQPPSFGQPHH